MFIECKNGQACLANDVVKVSVRSEESVLIMEIYSLNHSGVETLLMRRIGENIFLESLAAETPVNCSFSVQSSKGNAWLTIRGKAGPCDMHVAVHLSEGSRWVDFSEVLICHPSKEVLVNSVESVWECTGEKKVQVFSPHLTPRENDIIGRHVLRCPVLTAESVEGSVAMLASTESLNKEQGLPGAMNVSFVNARAVLRTGLVAHETRGHVFFTKIHNPVVRDSLHHAYHIFVSSENLAGTALRAARKHSWDVYGHAHYMAAQEHGVNFQELASMIYPVIFKLGWCESIINGTKVGAITIGRSFDKDVWMCPWFSQIRTAYGLYHWGKKCGNQQWVERAVACRNLHLNAPQENGLFPTLFVFGDDSSQDYWVESHHQGGGSGIYHIFDNAWTVYQLLRWQRDLLPSDETLQFAKKFAAAIKNIQRTDGGLPAYVDSVTRKPVLKVDNEKLIKDLESGKPSRDPYVLDMLRNDSWHEKRFERSAEDTCTLLALLELYKQLPVSDPERVGILQTAKGIASFVENWVIGENRWIDFEVYFSCSPKELDYFDSRSQQGPQNTLCMQLAAESFLMLYELCGDDSYLDVAWKVMSRMCMYQQIWNPYFLNINGFGGYGVMNTDGEWHDARQGQFAETHLNFSLDLSNIEQAERARSALRASIGTVNLPVSARNYPTGWSGSPAGMASENYAHNGVDGKCGISSFDWGSGSALATAAYFDIRGQLD